MRNVLFVLAVMPLSFSGVAQESPSPFTMETEYARWVIGPDAQSLSLLDKTTGTELLAPEGRRAFCRIRRGDTLYEATGAVQENGALRVSFADSGVEAILLAEVQPRYFSLSVLSLNAPDVEELTFLDLPLALKGTLDEPFAACALACNLMTNVPDIPGPSKRLQASAIKRFGIPGARIAVLACPAGVLRDVMKEAVAAAPDLPRHKDPSLPPIGGPWALDTPSNRGSYLFDFGTLTEETVDKWIDLLHHLGFTQVDFHTGTSLRFGDLTPNPKLFPNGRASVKAVIDKLHAAGISAGLHTYAFFIAKDSPYVTPVPDPRLGKDAAFTLAGPLDAAADTVTVAESTADVRTETGFFARNSVTLQVENELIVFSGVIREAPFSFTGCKRGAHGTAAVSHPAGVPVYKLKECFGLFAPDADSTLLTEVATVTADTFNECGFDMIYLDALDGEDILAGAQYSWHYGSKFVFDIASRLNRPALFEMSTFHHHLWFVRARMGAWDHPARSHKKFIDMHCAANAAGAGMFLPMNLGWWAVKTWQDGAAATWSEPTYPDDIEYLLGKALGNGMSLSLMGVNPDNLGSMPAYQRLLPLIRRYEDLRHSGTVPEPVKAQLRAPGAEFILKSREDGSPQFHPAVYLKHKVDTGSPDTLQWTVQNTFDAQPARLRIEALLSAAPYDSPEAVVLEDFANPDALALRRSAEGVTASLASDTALVKTGAASGRIDASSTRDARAGSWAQIGRAFSPPMNAQDKPALGFWVHGDGSGALLNLQALSARHTTAGGLGDHYVVLDFTGWRYQSLVEFEGGRITDFQWPYGDQYSIYREHVDFSALESFSLWLNDLPAGQPITCAISPVKALPVMESVVSRPVITINGVSLAFPVDIPTGASLEFNGTNECVLYGKKGEELARVIPEGQPVTLNAGENTVTFAAGGADAAPARARITLMAEGAPLAME